MSQHTLGQASRLRQAEQASGGRGEFETFIGVGGQEMRL